MRKSRRLIGRYLLLYYLQSELTEKDVLIQLKNILNFRIEDYFIFREENEIHVFIGLYRYINISPFKLDLIDPKTTKKIQGNYKIVFDYYGILNNYMKMHKNALTNIKEDFNYQIVYNQGTENAIVHGAIQFYEDTLVDLVVTSYNSLMANIVQYWHPEYYSTISRIKAGQYQQLNVLDTYKLPNNFLKWFNNNEKDVRTLILVAATDGGKTQSVIRLLKSSGYTPLIINDLSGLQEFNPELYDAVVFDSINYSQTDNYQETRLLDKRNVGELRILYGEMDNIGASESLLIASNNELKSIKMTTLERGERVERGKRAMELKMLMMNAILIFDEYHKNLKKRRSIR